MINKAFGAELIYLRIIALFPQSRSRDYYLSHNESPGVMNLTIGVDGLIPVVEGDRIASIAEDKLRSSIDFLQIAHFHPVKEDQ
jgi:hypothetical protein